MPENNEVEKLKAQLAKERKKAEESLEKLNAVNVAKKLVEENAAAQIASAQKDAEESLKLAEASEERAVNAESLNADVEEELSAMKTNVPGAKSPKRILHDRKIRNKWKYVDYTKPWHEVGLQVKDSVTGALNGANGDMKSKKFPGKVIHFQHGLAVTNHIDMVYQLTKIHHHPYMISYDPYCLKHKITMELIEGEGQKKGHWECPKCIEEDK